MAISCLLLASKFYLETQDVVVNSDIARILTGINHMSTHQLNKMELTMASLLNFEFYVSIFDYNRVANLLNVKVKRYNEEQMISRKKLKAERKSRILDQTTL